jgi:hypothetical protein
MGVKFLNLLFDSGNTHTRELIKKNYPYTQIISMLDYW